MSTDEPQPARQTWDGKAMTPIHDRFYGRPASAYGTENAPGASEPCADPPPPPCVMVMEETAHTSARKVLQALLNVDIDDANSVEAFQNRRRRDADLHRLMEKAISDTAWGAAKVAVAAIVVLAILHIKEILAWFGKP
ncbi:MAG TPA: hypothetical protein PLQ12_03905 [Candidatus Defluviicoccus seviourii]|nr:hypothetical protein [Candidatus Defluviicoccus seviourii]